MRVLRQSPSGAFLTKQLPLLLSILLFVCIHSATCLVSSSSNTRTNTPASTTTTTKTDLQVAVLVPGFLTGARDFDDLCAELTKADIPTVAVPMPAWEWIPCLGARSVRPILERIDYTVQHLIANGGDVTKIPPYEYTLWDCWNDFWTNPGGIFQVGGSSNVEEYPVVTPQGKFDLPDKLPDVKVGLIGHSAGGWISRLYLSDRKYGGKAFSGTQFVHTLVTLGTPHLDAPGIAFSHIRWVEKEEALVRSLAVGGSGFGRSEWGTFTADAYRFCGFEDDTTTGDGVTPLDSSFAYRGAEKLEIPGVHHINWSHTLGAAFVSKELTDDHRNGKKWYGSHDVVREWSHFLKTNSLE